MGRRSRKRKIFITASSPLQYLQVRSNIRYCCAICTTCKDEQKILSHRFCRSCQYNCRAARKVSSPGVNRTVLLHHPEIRDDPLDSNSKLGKDRVDPATEPRYSGSQVRSCFISSTSSKIKTSEQIKNNNKKKKISRGGGRRKRSFLNVPRECGSSEPSRPHQSARDAINRHQLSNHCLPTLEINSSAPLSSGSAKDASGLFSLSTCPTMTLT